MLVLEKISKTFEHIMAQKMAQCTEEEKKLIESYCADCPGEDYEVLSKFLDQYWFNASLIRTAENQVKAGGKTYVYYFRVEFSIPMMKSGHAIELSELFNHPEETLVTGRQFDPTFSKTMRKMWVQFAKSGRLSLLTSHLTVRKRCGHFTTLKIRT